MRILYFLILVISTCQAQYTDCNNPDTINISRLSRVHFNQPEIMFQIVADSIIDTYSIDLPCESWTIQDHNIQCDKKQPATFNSKGRFILTDEYIEKGICFCESCSKSARTISNSSVQYYVSGINCKGTATVKITNKVDEHRPKWLDKKITKGTTFNLSNLIFYPNKSRFMKSSYIELQYLLALMKSRPEITIDIQGHVNGPKQKNIPAFQKLSESRAKAVHGYLLKNGIKKNRIGHRGFGNTKMLFPKPKDESEMKKNRRVEILVK